MNSSSSKERLINLYGDDHPAFGSYLECMTRAYFTGLATFTLAFSSTYITQSLLKKHIPYKNKLFVLISSTIGTVAAYKVSTTRTSACQAGWMAAEDKSTYFTQNDSLPKEK